MADSTLREAERAYAADRSVENYVTLASEKIRAGALPGVERLSLDAGWDYVFSDRAGSRNGPNEIKAVEPALARDVSLGDVAYVISCQEGENDGPDWVALVALKDGAFAFVSAGCDYTGWG